MSDIEILTPLERVVLDDFRHLSEEDQKHLNLFILSLRTIRERKEPIMDLGMQFFPDKKICIYKSCFHDGE